MKQQRTIAIIGLGYVGLPLAVEFGKKYKTIGFDINNNRIDELKRGIDRTLEVDAENLKASNQLIFTSSLEELKAADFFIVTVPTPIDKNKRPDLIPLIKASETVGKVLKKNDIVVYESTVYPGCTEDDCVPILEKQSGLTFNTDFFCGYSPERINPGDKVHTVTKIRKITAGSTPETADLVNAVYDSIITAGTYKAPSIKVAEAAKVIENCQRDINIAFVNELAMIFDKMNIDTLDVLEAAGTKWNFLPFRPGLVGGHCIGVDPYYLTHKAEEIGYHSQVILSGRKINDNMGAFVANKVVKLMIKKGINVNTSKALVLGITFKENCPDIRNSRVIDIITELKDFGVVVDIYDPNADKDEVHEEYGVSLVDQPSADYDSVIMAVSHANFHNMDLGSLCKDNFVIYDVKSVLDKNNIDGRL